MPAISRSKSMRFCGTATRRFLRALPGGYRLSAIAASFALGRLTVDVSLLSRWAGSHTLDPLVHTL
jgi:hypothetical protein